VTPLVSPALWFINKCEAGADCSAEHECFEGVAGRGLHINNQKQKKKKWGKKDSIIRGRKLYQMQFTRRWPYSQPIQLSGKKMKEATSE